MSDYLTLLASRALGLMPVVRPRLPGRFEPVRPVHASGDSLLEAIGETGTPPDIAVQAQGTRGQQETAIARAALRETPAPGTAGEPPLAVSEHPAALAQQVAAMIPQTLPPAAPDPSRRPAGVTPGRHHAPAGLATATSAAYEARPQPGASVMPLLRGVAEQPASQPRPAPPQEPSQRFAVPVPQVAAPGPSPDSSMPHEAPSPVAGPAVEAAPPAWRAAMPPPRRWRQPSPSARSAQGVETREAAPPEPAIRVTIGRIEVRAAPPAEQALPLAPRHPALSLSEYLRDRDGAGP